MKINRRNIDLNIVKEAARAITKGKLVAFPTETVYGLGANALDEAAVKKIFKAKSRPADNPLILHISEFSQLRVLAKHLPRDAQLLAKKYWPGPLTIVVEKSDLVPSVVTAGLPTVAVRMPSHEVALALIKTAGVPIAAPSANLSGRPSPTTAEHVIEDLYGKVDIIIDSGPTDIGLESTVINISRKPYLLLRPGRITLESLSKCIPIKLHPALKKTTKPKRPESPGMKYRHYAPRGKLILLVGDRTKLIGVINQMSKEFKEAGLTVGVFSPFKAEFEADRAVLCYGSKEEFAKKLFMALREFDSYDIDIILVAGISAKGLGRAVMNRLEKAAVYKVINL